MNVFSLGLQVHLFPAAVLFLFSATFSPAVNSYAPAACTLPGDIPLFLHLFGTLLRGRMVFKTCGVRVRAWLTPITGGLVELGGRRRRKRRWAWCAVNDGRERAGTPAAFEGIAPRVAGDDRRLQPFCNFCSADVLLLHLSSRVGRRRIPADPLWPVPWRHVCAVVRHLRTAFVLLLLSSWRISVSPCGVGIAGEGRSLRFASAVGDLWWMLLLSRGDVSVRRHRETRRKTPSPPYLSFAAVGRMADAWYALALSLSPTHVVNMSVLDMVAGCIVLNQQGGIAQTQNSICAGSRWEEQDGGGGTHTLPSVAGAASPTAKPCSRFALLKPACRCVPLRRQNYSQPALGRRES